ncbi:hypothetical protein QE450_000823 [Paenibacillus sp. SORGH_AS306]|uniref:hypothetical protein n=1 Tax=unclassified Paenibacillus TaxID=185978 RepID=UPI00277F9794|nr:MULTISPECIES: hypothetical protein [unclassified Paenibacillus]MDQ1233325.1 hypothetical protein [Paenibacillus sp. SORGH_AS_0306]MDR6110366.1 hypothetical protein [Paenibacillus sp. SORGH_AS_0338]
MNASEVWNQHYLRQIRGWEAAIDADQAEIDRCKEIVEKVSRNSLKTKVATEQKAYGDFLESIIIPRYKKSIVGYRQIIAGLEEHLLDIEPTLF